MTVNTTQNASFLNKTVMKEYAIALAIVIYPSYKIKQIAEYALSDDSENSLQSSEEKQAMKMVSTATATIASFYIAILAQKILGILRKSKYRSLLVALSLAAPIWREGYQSFSKALKDRKFSPVQSQLIIGTIALASLAGINTITKKVI